MSFERVQGLAEASALFDRLPDAAEAQLGVELAILGREALDAQRAATPDDTGALRAGLSLRLQIAKLRLQVGLLGVRSRSKGAIRRAVKAGIRVGRNYGDLYYGRFVNFGRRAQTVVVQRRRRGVGKWTLRSGRKRAEDIATTYTLKVSPKEGRHFVDAPGPDFERVAAGQLAEFWSRTLGRAGAA